MSATANIRNCDEAERAKENGRKLMTDGDFERAARLFEISLRLNVNPDTSQLLASAKAAIARQHGVGHTSIGQANRNRDYYFSGSAPLTENPFIRYLLNIEARFISPSMRPYIRGMLLAIICLSLWRFVFHKKLALGELPGDINVSWFHDPQQQGSPTSNVIIHAPIVSCLLISFIFNAVMRVFQR